MGRSRDFHSAARTDPGYLGERLAIARQHHHNLLTTHITEPRAEMARQAELAFTSNRTVALLLGSLGAMEALVSAEFARAEAKPKGPRLCDVFAKQMRRVEPDAAVNVLGPAIEALMIDGFGTGALLYEPSATEIPAHRPTSWSASLKGCDDASSRSRILFRYLTAYGVVANALVQSETAWDTAKLVAEPDGHAFLLSAEQIGLVRSKRDRSRADLLMQGYIAGGYVLYVCHLQLTADQFADEWDSWPG